MTQDRCFQGFHLKNKTRWFQGCVTLRDTRDTDDTGDLREFLEGNLSTNGRGFSKAYFSRSARTFCSAYFSVSGPWPGVNSVVTQMTRGIPGNLLRGISAQMAGGFLRHILVEVREHFPVRISA